MRQSLAHRNRPPGGRHVRSPDVAVQTQYCRGPGPVAGLCRHRADRLASRYLLEQPVAAVTQAVQQLGTPPTVTPEPPNQMFEQYQQNLHKQEQQQTLDQARANPRNLSNPKCQFWLQQDQNAPSDKSRANVLQFCD